MQEWIFKSSIIGNAESEQRSEYLSAWCGAVLGLLKEYGRVIQYFPQELHYIDIESFFSSKHLTGAFLPKQDKYVRERDMYFDLFDRPKPKPEIESHRRLLPQPEYDGRLGFFLYDEKRDVFHYSERMLISRMEMLWVQDRQTGRRLPPMNKTLNPEPHEGMTLKAIIAVFSRDFRYLGIFYEADEGLYTTIWEIEDRLDFHDIKQKSTMGAKTSMLV